MREKKSVYLLSGGRRGRRSTDPALRAVIEETGYPSPKVAYIGVANGDNPEFFTFMTASLKEAGAGPVEHAKILSTGADLARAKLILREADAVFIGGGDVDAGMKALRERDMIPVLSRHHQRGTVFFGASAGAIMLAWEWVRWPDPENLRKTELFPCLGYAPVICDTHDEEGGWEELKAALALEPDNTIGYGIATGSSLKVSPEGELEAIGGEVHRFIRRLDRIQQLPALVPPGR